jgi:hypothetical protein
MTATRLPRNTASVTECVTNRAVNPRSVNSRCSSSFNRSLVCSSSAPNGSSNRNRSGSSTSERASEARIRMPPDSAAGRTFSNPSSPTIRMAAAALLRRSARGTRSNSASSSTLRRTVLQGSSVGSWKTYPTRSASTSADPIEGTSRPDTSRSRVLFPQPDGPTMLRNSPRRRPKVRFSTATVRSENVRLTPRSSTIPGARGVTEARIVCRSGQRTVHEPKPTDRHGEVRGSRSRFQKDEDDSGP